MLYSVADLPGNVSLHGASVVRVHREVDARFAIELDDVYVEGGLRGATLILNGVGSVRRDGAIVGAFMMEFADGEILSCSATEHGVALIIEWTDFSNQRTITAAYRIQCQSAKLKVSDNSE